MDGRHAVSEGVSHFLFLKGAGGGVLWWALPRRGRPGVSEVREEVRRYMCVCRGVGLPWAYVLAFFGEQTALVVVCGGCTVSSGDIYIYIYLYTYIIVCGMCTVSSGEELSGMRERYALPCGWGARPAALLLVGEVCECVAAWFWSS